ncbi:MAG: hypothetical protein M5U31_09760 [Acidimicrobiia bacterium]|nr:hypothetical protein [Acidimicrobiia bacterium]
MSSNTATTAVQIAPGPALEATLSVDGNTEPGEQRVELGEEFDLVLSVDNVGTQDLSDVTPPEDLIPSSGGGDVVELDGPDSSGVASLAPDDPPVDFTYRSRRPEPGAVTVRGTVEGEGETGVVVDDLAELDLRGWCRAC